MPSLLNEPFVQSAIAPYSAALIAAFLLQRRAVAGQGLAVSVGLIAAVLLLVGPQLMPLTATRKLVLVSLLLPLLVVPCVRRPRATAALIVGGGLAGLFWLLWPVLSRGSMGDALGLAAMPVLGMLLFLIPAVPLSARPARLAGAGLVTAAGTGAACVLGATALYGQLAFAVAAALAGVVSLWLWRHSLPPLAAARVMACAVMAPLALLAAAATVYASLPTLSLLALGLVPWSALLPFWGARSPLWQGLSAFGLGLIPAGFAAAWAWQVGGSPLY